jgi:methylmalonyl-CoA/ethylmalonyl-CoA epimerase
VKVEYVDHVAIAVRSLRDAWHLFGETLGGQFLGGGDDDVIGLRTIQLKLGGRKIELLEPLGEDSYLRRYLDKRGEGFHHLTIVTEDVEEADRALRGAGFETVDMNLGRPVWRELFVRPKSAFGALLQIADTTRDDWGEPNPNGVTVEDVFAGRAYWNQEDGRPYLRS